MDLGMIRGFGTVILMLAFIGLCFWAYSPRQRRRFDDAAQLPFQGDDTLGTAVQGGQDDE